MGRIVSVMHVSKSAIDLRCRKPWLLSLISHDLPSKPAFLRPMHVLVTSYSESDLPTTNIPVRFDTQSNMLTSVSPKGTHPSATLQYMGYFFRI